MSEDGANGRRILVIEDEAMVAMGLEMILAEAGCNIVGPVGALCEAERVAREGNFDFALLDVNLRGEYTYEIADILGSRGIPFAFLTGYGPDSLPERFRSRQVLTKPFKANDLLNAVDQGPL